MWTAYLNNLELKNTANQFAINHKMAAKEAKVFTKILESDECFNYCSKEALKQSAEQFSKLIFAGQLSHKPKLIERIANAIEKRFNGFLVNIQIDEDKKLYNILSLSQVPFLQTCFKQAFHNFKFNRISLKEYPRYCLEKRAAKIRTKEADLLLSNLTSVFRFPYLDKQALSQSVRLFSKLLLEGKINKDLTYCRHFANSVETRFDGTLVEFQIENKSVSCNLLLLVQIPFFKKFFHYHYSEQAAIIEIEGISLDSFKRFYSYLKNSQLDESLNSYQLIELTYLADYLGFDDLKRTCLESAERSLPFITTRSIVNFFNLAFQLEETDFFQCISAHSSYMHGIEIEFQNKEIQVTFKKDVDYKFLNDLIDRNLFVDIKKIKFLYPDEKLLNFLQAKKITPESTSLRIQFDQLAYLENNKHLFNELVLLDPIEDSKTIDLSEFVNLKSIWFQGRKALQLCIDAKKRKQLCLNTIKKIEFDDRKDFAKDAHRIAKLIQDCSFLEDFWLFSFDLMPCGKIIDILAQNHNLRVLALPEVTKEGLKKMARLRELRCLFVQNASEWDDEALEILSNSTPYLEQIELLKANNVTDEAWGIFFSKLKNLRTLSLNACSVQQEACKAISRLPSVELVRIESENLAIKELAGLLNSFTLKILHLTGAAFDLDEKSTRNFVYHFIKKSKTIDLTFYLKKPTKDIKQLESRIRKKNPNASVSYTYPKFNVSIKR